MIPAVILARYLLVLTVIGLATVQARAHDLERTQVALTFAADGTFVLEISNDPNWLLLRLESFAPSTRVRSLRASGPILDSPAAVRDRRLDDLSAVFIDRVVLFVDGHEVRPESAEYLPPRAQTAAALPPLATYRLRGRVPAHARTLRWLYGLVIDPYSLTVRRADGRAMTEWIHGSNWSDTFDLSGQFRQATAFDVMRDYLALGSARILPTGVDPNLILLGLFVVAVVWRWRWVG